MPCALFGKLFGKRDFISVNMPRDLLLAWEAWLQGSLASSRNELQDRWLKAYLEAPLWRFWLGAELCGLPVKGVFMSSMDGVGRHFPLTVFTFPAAAGADFSPPSDGAGQDWFEAAEHFLLSTIDAGEDYDAVLTSFAALADDVVSMPVAADPCIILHGTIVTMAQPHAGVAHHAPQLPVVQVASTPIDQTATASDLGGRGHGANKEVDNEVAAAVPGRPEDPCEVAAAAQSREVADQAGDAIMVPSESDMTALVEIADDDSAGDIGGLPAAGVAQTGALAQTPAPTFGFASLQEMRARVASRHQSIWWTIGGHNLPAMAMLSEGLPDPRVMKVMLVGASLQTGE